ncbi:Carboxypeptidase S [Leucoagaricus sp. SymC.cos]|nr:Carboxypeptidase S [Leucoagaricus sp. SymC.cos]
MKEQSELEPDYLPISAAMDSVPQKPRKTKFRALFRLLLLGGIAGSVWAFCRDCRDKTSSAILLKPALSTAATCAQIDILNPEKYGELWANLSATIATDDFKSKAVDRLSRAVQIPTESWDAMDPVGVDPRWEVFIPFQEYLKEAFPLVHSTLKLTRVNTYGQVFEWTGSSPDLKPVLLAAHEDVVPVERKTVGDWTHPPFSGYFDGERIWGRGSSDDKSGLIAILTAVETLISNGFQPTRTFVLAFGFDEEVSGLEGAAKIGPALLDHYGKHAFAFIIDEGSGFGREYDTVFATPGIAEKGYIDVRVEIATAGGHSSVPPEHTSIGILAAMLVQYEQNPFKVHFTRDDPMYEYFQCFAEHATGLPDDLRKLIIQSLTSDHALSKLTDILSKNRVLKSLLGTTQAIDLINGGIKTNALPEQAHAVVNHRIAVSSSLKETQTRDIDLLRPLAERFNLTFTAFGESMTNANGPSQGSLTLSDAFNDALEPAPITSTDAAPYQLLSGTIKATYNTYRGLEGSDNIIVAPGMMTGNTDTRSYWDLSTSIFRYNHQNFGDNIMGLKGIHTVDENTRSYWDLSTSIFRYNHQNFGDNIMGLKGIHTVDENMEIDTFLEMIQFFSIGILAAMLVQYEQNPFKVHFTRDDPMYEYFQCFAEHATGLPDDLRKLIIQSLTSDHALSKLTDILSKNRVLKSLLGTTQAIDLINGGIKTNALPEQAHAVVNHRIAVSSSLKETQTRDIDLLRPLAERFNLTFTAFGESMTNANGPSQGSLTLSDAFNDALEPAPITSTDAAPYQLLSGTIKATYNTYRGLEGSDNIIVAPGMMTGNTDTRSYWDLSTSIFRYNHQNFGDNIMGLKGIHTVDESMEIDTFLEMIQFFVTLVLNSDESTRL